MNKIIIKTICIYIFIKSPLWVPCVHWKVWCVQYYFGLQSRLFCVLCWQWSFHFSREACVRETKCKKPGIFCNNSPHYTLNRFQHVSVLMFRGYVVKCPIHQYFKEAAARNHKVIYIFFFNLHSSRKNENKLNEGTYILIGHQPYRKFTSLQEFIRFGRVRTLIKTDLHTGTEA